MKVRIVGIIGLLVLGSDAVAVNVFPESWKSIISLQKKSNFDIENTTQMNFLKVESDDHSRPIVFQAYAFDPKIILEYRVHPKAFFNTRYQFPQDFMVELPRVRLEQHTSKRLDQIAILGTHNSYTNPIDGFLYYQQQDSMKHQFDQGGVRLLRPAWHHPSGSKLEDPHEPILCHSSPGSCDTVSLATRGFKPHKTVKDFNQLVLQIMQQYKDQILLIGINNYLESAQSDAEIDKVPELKEFIITDTDLNDSKNHKEWKGLWPTLDWMIKNNKRLLYLNDKGSTKYTVDYKKYVVKNMFGTSDIYTSSQRRHSEKTIDDPLMEMSWFQNVSLPIHDLDGLRASIGLYWSVVNNTPRILAKAFAMPIRLLKTVPEQSSKTTFESFLDIMTYVIKKPILFVTLGVATAVINRVRQLIPALQDALVRIKDYVPVRQDNSFATLLQLTNACRSSGVLAKNKFPNIVLLDFATTNGDGMRFVNAINILVDQKMNLNFGGLGGLCLEGQLVSVEGLLQEHR